MGTLHTIFIHEVPNGMRVYGQHCAWARCAEWQANAAKEIACKYKYKKTNITLMEVRPKELANHVLLDLAREASIALMEVHPAC